MRRTPRACHRLTSERKSYDWLPLLCLRLRYHDSVYGQRKCSLLAQDYPFVWQRHANPYDFCLLFRPLSLTYMISSLCLFLPPSYRLFASRPNFSPHSMSACFLKVFFPFALSLPLSAYLSPFLFLFPLSRSLFPFSSFFLDPDSVRNISFSCTAVFFQVSRTSTT